MARRFFSGRTLEQAVLAAARHHAIEPEQVAYTQREKKHGFLNVRRAIVVEVDPGSPTRPAGEEVPWEPKLAGRPERRAPAPSPARQERRHEPARQAPSRAPNRSEPPGDARPPARPAPEIVPETDDPLDAADLALVEIADFLLFDMEWEIQLAEDDTLLVDLSGEDGDRIIEEDGAVLRSIEHLMPRLVRSKLGRIVPCTVDCEGFHAARIEELQASARAAAEEVRATGEDRLMEPMTPADRRIVHIELVDDPNVATESEGSGFTRRVRISPVG